jgi:hypothetical protein
MARQAQALTHCSPKQICQHEPFVEMYAIVAPLLPYHLTNVAVKAKSFGARCLLTLTTLLGSKSNFALVGGASAARWRHELACTFCQDGQWHVLGPPGTPSCTAPLLARPS